VIKTASLFLVYGLSALPHQAFFQVCETVCLPASLFLGCKGRKPTGLGWRRPGDVMSPRGISACHESCSRGRQALFRCANCTLAGGCFFRCGIAPNRSLFYGVSLSPFGHKKPPEDLGQAEPRARILLPYRTLNLRPRASWRPVGGDPPDAIQGPGGLPRLHAALSPA